MALILNECNVDATVSRASELKMSKKSFAMGQKVALGWRTLKLKQWGQSVYVRVRRGYENVLNAIMGGHSAGIA